MTKPIVLKGRTITEGLGEGKALVTNQFFGFTHGVDPATGRIADKRHEWLNQNLNGKILVFPYGKSSSSGGLFILEMVRCGNGPAAVINLETEPVIGAGFIMAKILYNREIPVLDHLDKNPIDTIKNGDYVVVDGYKGEVRIMPRDTNP